ncbi:DUF3219 family protein [Fredinandcohnia humi]
MINNIILDDTTINVSNYHEVMENGLHKITVDFKVTSEEYHGVTTLLYRGIFDLQVPERGISCKVTIKEYFTSITNLYEVGQVGNFTLTLLEVKE